MACTEKKLDDPERISRGAGIPVRRGDSRRVKRDISACMNNTTYALRRQHKAGFKYLRVQLIDVP